MLMLSGLSTSSVNNFGWKVDTELSSAFIDGKFSGVCAGISSEINVSCVPIV